MDEHATRRETLKHTLSTSWMAVAAIGFYGTIFMGVTSFMQLDAKDNLAHKDQFIAEKIKQYTPVCFPELKNHPDEKLPADMTCPRKMAEARLQQSTLSAQGLPTLMKIGGGMLVLSLGMVGGMIIHDKRKLAALLPAPK